MKNLQKVISVLLVFAMVFAFASCKDNKTDYEQSGSCGIAKRNKIRNLQQ